MPHCNSCERLYSDKSQFVYVARRAMQPFTSSRVTKRDSSSLLSSGGERDGPPKSAMALAAGEVLLATLDDAEL